MCNLKLLSFAGTPYEEALQMIKIEVASGAPAEERDAEERARAAQAAELLEQGEEEYQAADTPPVDIS